MISDAEIRFRLLTHFYALRYNAEGWVPASDIILSPDPVPIHVIGGVCQQLADVGLIQWKPAQAGSGFAGMAKITGEGVAAVEARRSDKIEIRFPPEDAPAAASPTMGEPILQAIKLEWLTAAEASSLLKPVFNSEYLARKTICKRAHNDLIRARARRFVEGDKVHDECEVPKRFWWAEGEAALTQNWTTGDFETWINQELHLQAFGVSFLRADIEKLAPASTATSMSFVSQRRAQSENNIPEPKPQPAKGGRPRADWWEDLWIEICRQLYVGDLQPKTQADVERAMHQWISSNGHDAGETTVRDRASKLWRAIKKDEN